MPKTNTNKNRNDPRTSKSIRDIKRAMLELVAEEPYDQIQAEQIMKAAPVNKNTFYKYFSSKLDVLDAVREDLLSEMIDRLNKMPDKSLWGGVDLFYNYLNTNSPARYKLLNANEYSDFADKLSAEFFAADFFKSFCDMPEHQEMVSDFIADVSIGVYRRWKNKPKDERQDLEKLAEMTAHILMDGLKGIG